MRLTKFLVSQPGQLTATAQPPLINSRVLMSSFSVNSKSRIRLLFHLKALVVSGIPIFITGYRGFARPLLIFLEQKQSLPIAFALSLLPTLEKKALSRYIV
jgi:hypothetical protein